jgi:hypothetical protein
MRGCCEYGLIRNYIQQFDERKTFGNLSNFASPINITQDIIFSPGRIKEMFAKFQFQRLSGLGELVPPAFVMQWLIDIV